MCSLLNIWAKKWQDVRYCPYCKRPIFITNRTEGQNNIPEEEKESIIDYLIFTGYLPHWVECKGRPGQMRLPYKEISQKQRNFLNSWTERGVSCWLFILLGKGRAPTGKFAWLIPWGVFSYDEDNIHADDKSLSIDDMHTDYGKYELVWVPKTGFTVPLGHIFYDFCRDLPPLWEKE
jgi:penicillin-binding protein-related factor A (putative recombinase)